MAFFTRLKTGWTLSMDSLGVLRSNPSLTLFPLVAGIAGAVYIGLVLGGSILVTGTDPGIVLYAVLFVVYLGSSFIAAFFSAALMYNTREIFHEREPTLRDGIAAAWRNRTPLFVWAVISAVVGVAFRALENEDVPLGDLASILLGAAWGILTYFVVPVIVFEDVSVTEMFKRSGGTFKRTWGETAGAGFGVGIVTMLFTLGGLAVAGVVFLLLGGTVVGVVGAIAIGALVLLLAYLLGTALGSIAKTALYIYATENERPDGFGNVDFANTAR
jgi:hypothetical protein